MSTVFTKQNAAKVATICTQRINALNADVTAKTQIPINGTLVTLANVVAIYQETIDQQAALTEKRAEVKATLAARDAAVTACEAADGALQAWVVNQFGANSQQAHDFGFGPKKARSVSAQTKAEAVTRALATRKARNTMGKKQRLKITGTVPTGGAAPVVSSVASPAAVTAPTVANAATVAHL